MFGVGWILCAIAAATEYHVCHLLGETLVITLLWLVNLVPVWLVYFVAILLVAQVFNLIGAKVLMFAKKRLSKPKPSLYDPVPLQDPAHASVGDDAHNNLEHHDEHGHGEQHHHHHHQFHLSPGASMSLADTACVSCPLKALTAIGPMGGAVVHCSWSVVVLLASQCLCR
jgi:hypothetical protein